MLKMLMSANALAGALLMTTVVITAQAMPAFKPEVSKSEGVTLVGRGGHGGGGGGGGFAMRGGGGGGGFAMHGGGGGGMRFHGGGGAPRFAHRGGGRKDFDGPRGGHHVKGHFGRRFAGDFKHHRFVHKHRKFHRFAFFGVPAVYAGYGDYGCGWLYRRAIVTGSPYWWNRYYACQGGYYNYY